MEKQFIEHFKEALEINERNPEPADEFRHYDEWDSLSQLSLIAMLDDEYGVEIENEEFAKLKTIQDLIDTVKKRQSGE